jgi:ribose-phosphate pyrophosphokinase
VPAERRTIAAAVEVLLAHGARPEIAVLATHGLFVGGAADRFAALPVDRVVVTDTVPPGAMPGVPLEVVSVASLLADAIRRLHQDEPLDDLLVRT